MHVGNHGADIPAEGQARVGVGGLAVVFSGGWFGIKVSMKASKAMMGKKGAAGLPGASLASPQAVGLAVVVLAALAVLDVPARWGVRQTR